MTTPSADRLPVPSSGLLKLAREWARTASGRAILDADEDGASAGDLTLLLTYLDATNPFPDSAHVAWLGVTGLRPARVRHRLSSNEWLLDVDSEDGSLHPVRASAVEIADHDALTGHDGIPGHATSADERPEPRPSGPVEVCLDSAEENMTSELALVADHVLPERWNGWSRPVATASALADFLRRWRHNDPNGVWGDAFEVDGALLCSRSDDDYADSFPWVGSNRHGVALYDLTGWVWVLLPDR